MTVTLMKTGDSYRIAGADPKKAGVEAILKSASWREKINTHKKKMSVNE